MRMLSETTVGLVGFGAVARRMVPMLVGLGMRVVVWNRSDISLYPEAADVSSLPTTAEVVRQADVLSLHVALTDQTRHLVDADLLALMKPDSAIVNTGRGGLVDTAALRDAVESGHLRGAVLDVLADEPPDWQTEPAVGVDAIELTPHMAWLSEGSRNRGFDTAARAIVDAVGA
jgi:phosphoglycerate dehydrogenase-like enzyme